VISNLRFAALIGAVVLALGCQGGPSSLNRLDDSRRLVADARVQFSKATDATNRAVMADTDEASIAFASDAEKAVQGVESDVAALKPLLGALALSNEARSLEEFQKHWVEYVSLDREIRGLAVENTNSKAQALSFGPAREAADTVRDSLTAVASATDGRDRCRAEGLVAKATLAVREIQLLQAPHIAEADDVAMARMEQDMAALDVEAHTAVDALTPLTPASARPALSNARAALARFNARSNQIITLSRRNSNVRSLDLSLRKKPPLVATCDDGLRALQEGLANEGSKATR
jgi:hypothetical protein